MQHSTKPNQQADLSELTSLFGDQARGLAVAYAKELRRLAGRLDESGLSDAELRWEAHRIHGCAGLFGAKRTEAAARAVQSAENSRGDCRALKAALEADLAQLIRHFDVAHAELLATH